MRKNTTTKKFSKCWICVRKSLITCWPRWGKVTDVTDLGCHTHAHFFSRLSLGLSVRGPPMHTRTHTRCTLVYSKAVACETFSFAYRSLPQTTHMHAHMTRARACSTHTHTHTHLHTHSTKHTNLILRINVNFILIQHSPNCINISLRA